ncbi:hypothetical protein KI387_019364, partial [Taxus chinensis]
MKTDDKTKFGDEKVQKEKFTYTLGPERIGDRTAYRQEGVPLIVDVIQLVERPKPFLDGFQDEVLPINGSSHEGAIEGLGSISREAQFIPYDRDYLQVIESQAVVHNATVLLFLERDHYPAIENDENLHNHVKNVGATLLGSNNVKTANK